MSDCGCNAIKSRGEAQLRGPGQRRPFCVVDKNGETVRCFRSKAVADRVRKSLGRGAKVKSKR
jgi:hypothetical protein